MPDHPKKTPSTLEKDEDIYALEKAALGKADTKQSSLACKLLSLWAHGLLSATMIREIASCALDDGAQHEELVHLAEAGSWGQQPGNIHRSILRRFCKDVGLEKPISVSVPCIDNKTTLEKVEQAQIYLPHLVFAGLAENYPSFFEDSMSLKHLEKFWLQVEKSGDDKLLGHPMTLEKAWRSKNIPLFLHGDGVEFQSRDSLLTFSFGALALGKAMTSLEANLYLAAFPKSSTHEKTWEPIWKLLSWSFTALGKGFHPEVDENGHPLEKGHPCWAMKGMPLTAKGWKAQIWCIIGDQEFFANHLKLGHWASHYPCWECDAENFKGAALEKAYKQISLAKQDFQVYTHAEHLEHPTSQHAVFTIPHVSCKNVRGDPLHILFCKGLYGHLIGSILHYVCWYEGPGAVCKKKPWERLALLFSQVQVEYSEGGTARRLKIEHVL